MDKKRILVAKIGGSNGRICYGKVQKDGSVKRSRDITSGCTEAKTIIDILDKSGRFEIGILTKVLSKDWFPEKYEFYSSLELGNADLEKFFAEKKFDYMLVINGSINCFGGAEIALIPDLCIWRMMHYFTGKIFFCQCDLALNLMLDLHKFARNKPWIGKYPHEEHDISQKDITMITQASDLDAILDEVNKPRSYKFKRSQLRHFSFERYPVVMPFAHVPKNDTPTYDLAYGGTLRAGRRVKKLVKYYFNCPESMSVHLYGKLDDPKLLDAARECYGDSMRMPSIGTICNFADNGKVLNQALATVVIGDEIFERTQTVQQRAWQAICANVIAFVDIDLDRDKKFYGHDDILKRFMYVSSQEDVVKRIEGLKAHPELRDIILKKQQEMLSFDTCKWAGELASIIEDGSAGA